MSSILCVMNSVNGFNTGTVVRTGPGKSYPSAGKLLKKNCPDGGFYIDPTVGGNDDYYKLLNPEKYPLEIVRGRTLYVQISSTYLLKPTPAAVKNAAAYETTQSKSVNQITAESGVTSAISGATTASGLEYAMYEKLTQNEEQALASRTRILGLPYQFTNSTDYRPYAEQNIPYGRKYLENIIAEAPIVYLTPGLPNFMPDINTAKREQIDAYVKAKSSSNGVSDEIIEMIMGIEGRYYDFVAAYSEYSKYVNLLCRVCAIYMGLGDKEVPNGGGATYSKFNWAKWYGEMHSTDDDHADKSIMELIADTVTEDVIGEYRFLKVYADVSTSQSESGSNSTTKSMVEGLFDTLEGIVREAGFFTNNGGILESAKELLQGGVGTTITTAGGALDPSVSAGISKIFGSATHVISGSNVIFPELWSESKYDKNYTINVNLICPYGNTEAKFLCNIVPLMHLLALSMPRQTSANSFGSPFLVRAFSLGWFSCELGMVNSISIEKVGNSWAVDGIPNEMKVSLSITDLYPSLMVSKTTRPDLFFNNQGLIEFLAVTCGININKGNLETKINSIISVYSSLAFDAPGVVYNGIIEGLRNIVHPWFAL